MTDNVKIFTAFIKAQSSFAPAIKNSLNPHFKNRYADLGACIEAVIDALHKNNLGFTQKTHLDDSGVTVETIFFHESGECWSGGLLHVPASKQDPQGYGSALSYARRYSLMAACGIAPEDDDGEAASPKKTQPKPPIQAAKPIVSGLSEDDVDTVNIAMVEAPDFDSLKSIFGPAFNKANELQKVELKTSYDKVKQSMGWK